MRTFEYRGYDGAGRAVKGLIEGADARDARERLAAGGVLAERVEPTRRRGRLTVEARTTLYRELATLLAAGVPLLRALETVLESAETGEERVAVAMARDGVRDGLSLAEALGAASGAVTDF